MTVNHPKVAPRRWAKPRASREFGSKLDPFREYLLGRMLGENPVSNAEVIYEGIREQGYSGGRTILNEFIRPFREKVKERTTIRFETRPGQQAQVHWGTYVGPEVEKRPLSVYEGLA